MSEYRNTTVIDIIRNYINKDTFLPAIQREFVWDQDQICKLFDSLMCRYPISPFLFWKVRVENKDNWTMYEFISDFDKSNPHNKEKNLNGLNRDINLVLDGQQRMTALFIGLSGSYTRFYYRERKEFLHINLLKEVDNDANSGELRYAFDFRENDTSNEGEFWYKVGDILRYGRAREARDAINKKISGYSEEQQKIIEDNLQDLHTTIYTDRSVSFYEEISEDYDKVLEIFVRMNSGGTKLEYSDLLLSTATAKWKNINAREEVHKFTDDEINKTDNKRFSFEKDFVLKGSMYLTDGLPIAYKVKSFTEDNLEKIENNWENIKNALKGSVGLLSSFGFNDKNIISRNAVLPIAFYLKTRFKTKNSIEKFIDSSDCEDTLDKNNIKRWFIIHTIRGSFSRGADSVLLSCQNVLKENNSRFPYKQLNERLNKNLIFDDKEIEKYLTETKYSTRYSFLILLLLYPDRGNKVYEEDHIFAQSEFSNEKLKERGYTQEKINEYREYYNTILNLELLAPTENNEKRAKPFGEWIKTRNREFKEKHLIPEMDDYGFDHFLEFIEKRKKVLSERFKKIIFE